MPTWLARRSKTARLARRAAAGDAPALRALYRALHDDVHRFVHRRVRERADAEDLVADVFVRLVDRLHTYDPARGSVRTWVLVMARNAIVDHVRRRRPMVPVEEVQDVLCASGPDPDDAIGLARDLLDLRRALAELPADARELLVLRYGDGLSHREIGGVLGLSEDACKQRCSRLIRELRARATVDPKGAPAHVV
jgi:RNA polymerase sigma-70 factor (ECF subfamily)